MGLLVLQSIWLALPVIAGGAVHIAFIKLGALESLARIPIDGGITFRGRRLFGDHKTVRGVVVMVAATAACCLLQGMVESRTGWGRALSLSGLRSVDAAAWGFLLGTGYVAGELPNSFLKRQLGIAPGERAAGWLGPVFWVVDQVDSLAGILVFMRAAWIPPLDIVMLLAAITLTVHPAVALAMMTLGLKKRVG